MLDSLVDLNLDLGSSLLLLRAGTGGGALGLIQGRLNALLYPIVYQYAMVFLFNCAYLDRKVLKSSSLDSVDVEGRVGVDGGKTAGDCVYTKG